MTDWPSSLPDTSREHFLQRPVKAQIKTQFESGAVQSRPKHTSTRWVFTLGWKKLTTTQYATLHAFFTSYIGSTFNFTHPETSTVYVVRFAEGELPDASPLGYIDGTFSYTLTGLVLEQA